MDADAVLPMAGVIFEPTSAPPVLPQGPRPQPLRARLSRIRISPDEPPLGWLRPSQALQRLLS